MNGGPAITPGLINSDIVENIFCQQRATYNGGNTNPTAQQYKTTLNSIILGQDSVSSKGNCPTAKAYAVSAEGPLRKKTKTQCTNFR